MNNPSPQALLGALKDRTFIEVRGADRATFLHNLCTNDIKALQPGTGCEAFFTNVQGKTLCHVFVLCDTESIFLSTDPGLAEQLLPHLDKYLIREDVQLVDLSSQTSTFLLFGNTSHETLQQTLKIQLEDMQHSKLTDFPEVRIARVAFAGANSYFVFASADDASKVAVRLAESGVAEADAEQLECARIEAGFPSSGRDITSDNLPQEIGRDPQAISFTKGCYLGQETVARIDALGRVNKLLVTIEFEGDTVPPAGTKLHVGEKEVGRITTSCWSAARNCALALGFVKREMAEQKATVSSEFGAAKVVA